MAGSVLGAMRVQELTHTSTPFSSASLPEVLAPVPDHDRDVDRAGERVHAELAVAAVDDGPDVAGVELVGGDRLEDRAG